MKNYKIFLLTVTLFQTLIFAQAKSSPAWVVDPGQYQSSANITVHVRYNNQILTSGANLLAAFAGDELRGVAKPVLLNSEQIYFLTVYMDKDKENISFREYFAAQDTVIPLRETQDIVPNGIYGSVVSPLTFFGYFNFDNPPVVSLIPDQIIEVGQTFPAFDLDTYLKEFDGDSATWSFSGNSQLRVSIDMNNFVTVTPPNNNWTGSETIRFRATDVTPDALFSEDTVVFRIRPLDHPPKLSALPQQKAGSNSDFPKLYLRNYLTEIDDDSVTWSYTFDESTANDPVPQWMVNAGDFSASMNVTCEVTSLGQPGSNANDLLAAFANGVIRGLAQPVMANGKALYYLTVFANGPGDTITFRFYDAVAHRNIPVDKKLVFISNGAVGNPVTPFEMYAGNFRLMLDVNGMVSVSKTDPAWTGTERIQFRVQDVGTIHSYWDTTSTNFTTIADHTPLVSGIPDQTVPKGNPFSSFNLNNFSTELDGDKVAWSYSGNKHLLIKIGSDNTVTVTAPDTIWTGSERIEFRVTDVTANALFSEDTVTFRITGKDHAPHILPIPNQVVGIGNSFRSVSLPSYLQEFDGDSVAWSFSFDAPAKTDSIPQWTVDPGLYEFSMNVTAEVRSDNVNRTGISQQLAAYVDDQLRGVASPALFNGKWVYFLSIFSNQSGEQIEFKFYDAAAHKIYPVNEKLVFASNAIYGSPNAPYQLNAGNILLRLSGQNILNVIIPDTNWYGTETVTIFATDVNTVPHFSDSVKVQFTRIHQVLTSIGGAAPSPSAPKEFALLQNYPNPFNPSTTSSYSIPKSGIVSLRVYDLLGREASTLVNATQTAGRYTVTFDGSRYASGIYLYMLQAGGSTITKKFTLLK